MEYSILHLKHGTSESVRGSHPWTTSQADVTVERDRLDAAGLAAVQQHRSVLAYAPCMPTRLIDAVAAAKPTKSTRSTKRTRAAPQKLHASKGAWGLDAVRATGCRWTGAGACVAVLDTGIARDHPAGLHARGRARARRQRPRHALRGHDLRPRRERHADRRGARRDARADRQGARRRRPR
jgi:hypothetical protein